MNPFSILVIFSNSMNSFQNLDSFVQFMNFLKFSELSLKFVNILKFMNFFIFRVFFCSYSEINGWPVNNLTSTGLMRPSNQRGKPVRCDRAIFYMGWPMIVCALGLVSTNDA